LTNKHTCPSSSSCHVLTSVRPHTEFLDAVQEKHPADLLVACSPFRLAFLLFFVVVVAAAPPVPPPRTHPSSAGKPAIGGPWSLVDLDGNLVTDVSFHGRWLLLYFGFARCPDICPSEMLKIARVIDQLKQSHPKLAAKLVPVFVSVDPARDSLSALREYAKDFHPDYVFLTGSPVQVQQMAKKYRVYVSKADETEDGDYLVDHSIVVYFHDDRGELSDCFTQSMRPKDIAEKIVEKMTASPTVAA
jgi:protein SCO1